MAAGADDQMIVHRNAQTLAGIDDRARDLDVGAAGGGVARRVVVHQDDCGGAQVDRTADHFAHMDLRLIDRSLAHHLVADQHVAAVAMLLGLLTSQEVAVLRAFCCVAAVKRTFRSRLLADVAVPVRLGGMIALWLGTAALMSGALADEPTKQSVPSQTYPAGKIEAPASAGKLILIRRFLRAIGRQDQLDSASFLERYAMPGGALWPIEPGNQLMEDLRSGFERRISALKKAYEKHRATYQKAYEDHVNWEFTEEELATIVAFLESRVGKHYLDGRWRMEAYTDTNTEDIEQSIVAEAQASLAK
jgi:hypothetical protein